ncbi:hypothetical protein NRF20_43200 [Streptomyces sp. R-74717]|uniref:hypothetical protein n=1 Tax=Streptomyces sp. R-74717 TaxID=2969820 RepID=UPI0039B64C59
MPDEPEDAEAGRELPEAVMRVLCASLDRLEELSSTETRVATELLIDTGRRPDEIYTLALDCLEGDPTARPCSSTTTTRPTGSAAACRSAARPPR